VELVADTAGRLFHAAVTCVLRHGRAVAPRGLSTREGLAVHMSLTDPVRRFVGPDTGRRINPAFAVAEALWILSGTDDPWIHEYNPRLAAYVGAGRPAGAYGPRIRDWGGRLDQIDAVIRRLTRDHDSRRAVVQIFDPARDHAEEVDVPCTLSHRVLIRSGELHLITTMRSQDVWLGLPYDIFTATLLQELMAGWLGVAVGTYHLSVDSLHLYEADLASAERITSPPFSSVPDCRPVAVDRSEFTAVVGQCLAGERRDEDGWWDFAMVLKSFRLWRSGARPQAVEVARAIPTRLGQALVESFHRSTGQLRAAQGGVSP
jgi:thymidylate synthase